MSKNDFAEERRKQQAFQRLGTNTPRCAACLETDWRCMELHHVAGQAFGNDTVILCRNCHRKLSDAQKGHPTRIGAPPSRTEQIAKFILGLGELLQIIGNKLAEYARELLQELTSSIRTVEH